MLIGQKGRKWECWWRVGGGGKLPVGSVAAVVPAGVPQGGQLGHSLGGCQQTDERGKNQYRIYARFIVIVWLVISHDDCIFLVIISIQLPISLLL